MVHRRENETLAELRRQWKQGNSATAMLHLADECRKQGRLTEAIAVLREGVRQHPGRLGPRIALGRCCLEAGDTAAATEILGAVVEQDPTQLVANKLLVEAHLGRGELDLAERRLELYAALNPGDPALEELRSHLGAHGPERPSTERSAGPAIEASPGSRWEEAEEPLSLFPESGVRPAAATSGPGSVSELFPGFESEAGDGGSAFWASMTAGPFGDPAEAPPEIEVPTPTMTLGNLYLEQGHGAQAAAIFRQLLERTPDHRAAQDGMAAAAVGRPRLMAADLLQSTAGGVPGSQLAAGGDLLRAYLQLVLGRS